MPHRVVISLGGVAVALQPSQSEGDYSAAGRASEFFTNVSPTIRLRVHCGCFPDFKFGPHVFETAQGWKLFHIDGKKVFRIQSPEDDPRIVAVLQPDFRSGEIYTTEDRRYPGHFFFPLTYPMGELFMMGLLGSGQGMLSHAAGVIHAGQGYLFTGNSGAGKTTTARLWQALTGAVVVNDDKVILRQVGGEYRLYGTPWHGEGGMASPAWAPLKRVFILKQAAANFTTQLSPSQAAVEMLRRAFIPLWDANAMHNTLAFLDGLCQSVDCRVLHFLPEHSAVEHVLSLEN